MGGKGSGPRDRYPWDRWLDGKEHTLTPGSDFTSAFESFRQQAYRAATARRIRVSVQRQGGTVRIRAHE